MRTPHQHESAKERVTFSGVSTMTIHTDVLSRGSKGVRSLTDQQCLCPVGLPRPR
jgi:hypothetical protein